MDKPDIKNLTCVICTGFVAGAIISESILSEHHHEHLPHQEYETRPIYMINNSLITVGTQTSTSTSTSSSSTSTTTT